MPEGAPLAKVEATKGYGAEVVLKGGVYDLSLIHIQMCIRDSAKGVYYAKDFLTYVTKEMLEQNTSVPADTAGKDVVIIGGGDTGIDCAAVAFAQGARSILQLELRECEMTGKTPVSYTHLDVYKRQDQTSYDNKAGTGVDKTAFAI